LVIYSSSALSIILKLQEVICVDWLEQSVDQHGFLYDREIIYRHSEANWNKCVSDEYF